MATKSNPFQILGVPVELNFKLSELEATYLELSRALHPDRFIGAPPSERREALNRAIEVNEAWRALKRPLSRAEAFARALGVEILERGQAPVAPAFLMQVMESREALAEVAESRDLDKLAGLIKDAQSDEIAILKEMSQLGENLGQLLPEAAAEQGALKEQLSERLGRLRYVSRFIEEAQAYEDELL